MNPGRVAAMCHPPRPIYPARTGGEGGSYRGPEYSLRCVAGEKTIHAQVVISRTSEAGRLLDLWPRARPFRPFTSRTLPARTPLGLANQPPDATKVPRRGYTFV